ncbi:MAG: SLATT domain-containing protein [Actinomycetota bacterium]|nr:SLATT domain-containing protein [Actinomycetota bacterium]
MKSRPKKVFEPDDSEELLRGWLLHAHKGRDRHDEAARRLDRYRYAIGVPATLFAAAAGTSAVAAWQRDAPHEALSLLAGAVGFIAAVLASLQTYLNYGARAEQHRVAGTRYKALIREMENHIGRLDVGCSKVGREPSPNAQQSRSANVDDPTMRPRPESKTRPDEQSETAPAEANDALASEAWLSLLQQKLDRLEMEAPVVPMRVFNRIEERFRGACFEGRAEKLVESDVDSARAQ